MLTLSDILRPQQVDLALNTPDPEKGLHVLATLLQGAPGMMHWEAFNAALKRDGTPIGEQSLLSHVRTDHVSTMLLAAGRVQSDQDDADATSHSGARFLFLIAVPITLAADYLRIVGALARCLRTPAIVASMQETRSPEEFVRILCDAATEM